MPLHRLIHAGSRYVTQTRHIRRIRQFLVLLFEVVAVWLAVRTGVSVAEAPAAIAKQKVVSAAAESDDLGKDWVRLRYDDKQRPLAMESAIIRYQPVKRDPDSTDSPVTVDLVGAVHIGDLAYYEELNRRLKTTMPCFTSWLRPRAQLSSAAAALPMHIPSVQCRTA